MFIYSIAVLFLAFHFSSGFDKSKIRSKAKTNCGVGPYTLRKTFIQEHDEKRAWFAEGNEGLPGAANMRFMAYDCELEKEAIKLTATCDRFPDETQFNKNRTNVASFDYQGKGDITIAREAVSKWWNTKEHWDKLQKITGNDSAMPFFLMAQAGADKVGCSVNLCGGHSHYTVACVYGKKARVGNKLYKKGPACSKCDDGDTCYQEALCRKE